MRFIEFAAGLAVGSGIVIAAIGAIVMCME